MDTAHNCGNVQELYLNDVGFYSVVEFTNSGHIFPLFSQKEWKQYDHVVSPVEPTHRNQCLGTKNQTFRAT